MLMSMTSFFRRMSVDSESPKPSTRSGRESRESPRKSIPRRSRIVASIDSARRRFSLQHSNDDYHRSIMQATTLRDKVGADVGSLPDFNEAILILRSTTLALKQRER
ncbi:hypothetical protein GCK32_002010 [Trichostrongylus colubriformis]|uniref:Uncharacterized protein n=1 Tax=Trichostrongylus colubriformis TaxID=6319 RepID=A0AAN8FMF1_TRICO